ncbi:uncharacterized protein [Venturia canescens]|uniref:uncharacterized protein n=1 Tax=Venturia canescens TaxID=32260 RepID=UPI001C9C88CC|nr:uncharacterized protein LOC122417669 [Venturia canescens]
MAKDGTVFITFVVSLAVLHLVIVAGKPVETPTKFNINTVESVDRSSQSSPSTWEQGMELLGRVGDALRFGRGKLINSAIMMRNIIAERAEGLASEARNNVASVIAAKSDILAQGSNAVNTVVTSGAFDSLLAPKTRETARLENESDQALFEVKKGNPIGNLIAMYLRPTPLVDKIREEDKYGNSGDKFIGIGRALVGGFEGLSNFLNTVVDFPIDTAKKTSRGVSRALNELGGRLVGLQ